MKPNNDSLIERGARQPELLSSAEMSPDFFAADEARGKFTAERLFAREPRLYHAIVALTAERIGQIRIGEILGVSAHTVAAVQAREKKSVAMEKEELAASCMTGARMAFEGVVENLADPLRRAKISPLALATIGAIGVDKAAVLRGEATMRVEIDVVQEPDHDAFNRYIAGLRAATCQGGETAGLKGPATAATAERTEPGTGQT
jgi:hypothetical protein